MTETFTELLDSEGAPNAEALLEQTAGMVDLYFGDQGAAQQLLDLCGGGEILYWFFDPSNPVPCLAYLHQGNHYYAWIAGTVNINQWIGNVQGFLSPQPFQQAVLVHSYFWSLAQKLWVAGQSKLPAPAPGIRFTLTGHSLGGAIAQILALQLAEIYGADNVELLTLGQPKAFTSGLEGPTLWPNYVRLRVPDDPVPMVPPDRGLAWTLSLGLPSAAVSVVFEWTHYGNPWILRDTGDIDPDPGLPFWQRLPGAWLTTTNPSNHLIKNIFARLELA